MLALTAELADGAHPYNVTPEHTAQARQILGPDKWICTEQKVMLETDPAVARAAARKNLAVYLPLPNYRNNLKRIGFTEADFENGGSDRLMDGLVAWGDEAAIRTRLQAHLDAGADQVCIQSVRPDGDAGKPPDEKIFALLAPKNG
jgi:probable F420-dependent oxidoreductase